MLGHEDGLRRPLRGMTIAFALAVLVVDQMNIWPLRASSMISSAAAFTPRR
jgi:hypothetical protein